MTGPTLAATSKSRRLWDDPLGRSATLIILVAVSLGGFVTMADRFTGTGGPGNLYAALGLAALVIVIASTRRAARASVGQRVSKSSLYLAALYVGFGVVFPALLAGWFPLVVGEFRYREDLGRAGPAIWLLASGISIALVAHVGTAKRRRDYFGLNRRKLVVKRLVVAFATGLLVTVVNLSIRGRFYDGRSELPEVLAPFEQFIGYGTNVMLLGIAGLASLEERRFHNFARAMVVMAALVGFAEGFFKPTLWALLAYGLGRGWSKEVETSRPAFMVARRWAPVLIVGTLLIVAVVPLVQATRVGQTVGSSPAAGLGSAYSESWGSGPGTAWDAFKDKVVRRQSSVLVGAIRVVERVPDSVAHKGVTDLLTVPVYGIPRALWPSKPDVSSGRTVSVVFFDAPADTVSSSTLLLFGDAYWYGGLLAVAIVAVGVGVLLGIVDSSLRTNAAAICKLAALPLLIDFDRGVALWSVGAVQGVLVLCVVGFVVSRPCR